MNIFKIVRKKLKEYKLNLSLKGVDNIFIDIVQVGFAL